MTEEKAIRLCLKHRDPSGFEFLVRQFRREAYYHAQAWLGNESDAADAVQDSFAAAFAAMPGLTELDRFYPWFYRILRNRCLNLLARVRIRDRYREEQCQEAVRGPSVETSNPRTALEADEERTRVWRQLSQLKPKHREILTLKYIHEFSYAEIAETLGIPRGTVMSRLYESRAQFRERFLRNQDSAHLQPQSSLPRHAS